MFKRPSIWLYTSCTTVLVSIVLIAVIQPVWGIDFVGGSLLEIEGDSSETGAISSLLTEKFSLSSTIQTSQDNSIIIRIPTIDEQKHQEIIGALREASLLKGEERRFESIGPTIGHELRRKSIWAITIVVFSMIAYLAYEFRKMKGWVSPWKFGVAAVWAVIHDVLLVTAAFVIFGKVWDTPIDTLFVTAQLAIFGYSVNDTIVMFNRIKMEWLQRRSANLLEVIDISMLATLGRSLNTSFTTLLALVALLVFGGSTIRWFIVALTLGTITGTYSTWYVASPLLYYLAKR